VQTIDTDCGKVVSLTRRPRYSPHKHYFSASDTDFCQGLSKLQGLVRLKGLGKLITLFHLIESRARDLPACTVASQPLFTSCPAA
jgi:hypothetical protein